MWREHILLCSRRSDEYDKLLGIDAPIDRVGTLSPSR